MSRTSKAQVNRCQENRHQYWWNALHYSLAIQFDLDNIYLKGQVEIQAVATHSKQSVVQLDLQSPMNVSDVYYKNKQAHYQQVNYVHELEAVYITIPFTDVAVGDTFFIKVHYEGTPKMAVRAPWDGGLSVSMSQHKSWWGMSCQMEGASIFFPCKDVLSDEPELGVRLKYTVPKGMQAIGNGRGTQVEEDETTTTYHYEVTSSINLYNITFYIGDYAAYQSIIDRPYGKLSISWWYIKENAIPAADYFQQIPTVLDALEYWAGPYPYSDDGFNVVEAPYLGMEHQSAIAYGNGYQPGYLGKDRSGSGAGLLFDFILIHEAAHEWFGNAISVKNACDFWVHEGFTTYMESLYLEYLYGYDIAKKYRIGKFDIIANKGIALGDCNRCTAGNGDEYDKGAAMIHHLRMLMRDDQAFKEMLHTMVATFKNRVVDGQDIIDFMQQYYPFTIQSIFVQYLQQEQIPTLVFKKNSQGQWMFKWENSIQNFDQPIIVENQSKRQLLFPKTEYQAWPYVEEPSEELFSQEWLIQMHIK